MSNGVACPNEYLTSIGFELPFGIYPRGPAVYAVLARAHVYGPQAKVCSHLIYIGSSNHVRGRVVSSNHPYSRCRERLSGNVVLLWKQCDDHRALEKELIRKLRPLFNIQHKYTRG